MKKIISMLLALSMLFVLSACTPNVDDLVFEANRSLLIYPYEDTFCVEGQYYPEYNCYFVLITINDDILDRMQFSKNFETTMALVADSAESNEIMNYMFDKISEIFKKTDVDVVVGFQNINGEITKTLSTIE